MNRRQWLTTFAAALAVLRWARRAHAQGNAYERAVSSALAAFSGTTRSSARIAPEDEPGVSLRIRGTLYEADGQTPAAGALVFAYHTDRHGLYNATDATHSWRLRGAVRTADDGTFEFQTIRPASYPHTTIPQHVHVELQTPRGRYHAGEWRFEDDQRVGSDERAASARAGEFGWIRPVRVSGGVETIDVKVRVDPARAFA
jgi:protocatechuate 3,4-dioxygenase beta subunit